MRIVASSHRHLVIPNFSDLFPLVACQAVDKVVEEHFSIFPLEPSQPTRLTHLLLTFRGAVTVMTSTPTKRASSAATTVCSTTINLSSLVRNNSGQNTHEPWCDKFRLYQGKSLRSPASYQLFMLQEPSRLEPSSCFTNGFPSAVLPNTILNACHHPNQVAVSIITIPNGWLNALQAACCSSVRPACRRLHDLSKDEVNRWVDPSSLALLSPSHLVRLQAHQQVPLILTRHPGFTSIDYIMVVKFVAGGARAGAGTSSGGGGENPLASVPAPLPPPLLSSSSSSSSSSSCWVLPA
eukprot:758579-Hanusia_phi.AAC.3